MFRVALYCLILSLTLPGTSAAAGHEETLTGSESTTVVSAAERLQHLQQALENACREDPQCQPVDEVSRARAQGLTAAQATGSATLEAVIEQKRSSRQP